MDEIAGWNRREFIRVAGAMASLLALDGFSGCAASPDDSPRLPSLGGAPDSDQGRTVAAFVDTIIPGKYRDPKGAPGGLDVGAPALFFDPTLPALNYVPLLVLILDEQANQLFSGKGFVALTPNQREQVLDHALIKLVPLQFAVTLAKLAYFSSAGAARHLGYPGANNGYINDAQFSFNKPLTKEITTNGNLD